MGNENKKAKNTKFSLAFESVEDGYSVDDPILQNRIIRENESLKTFNQITKKKFSDLNQLHDWLFTEHAGYASKRLKDNHAEGFIDEITLKSY